MISFFQELKPEQAPLAGGKGRVLARLYQAGHPVPNGLVVLPDAFDGDALKPRAWEQIVAALKALRAGQANPSFAVRSSGLSEDSAQASFAGEFETVLDVRDDEGIRRAIETVRRSRHAGRVAAYSQAQGVTATHEVAVVIQQLVPADFSGVLFTADPVTGNRMVVVGNAVRGLGEKLVSGEATALSFTFKRPRGEYAGPPELRRFAKALYRLAVKLEKELGGPQDIEWAIAHGRLALLQARPITTLRGHDAQTGEWNDSLTGDYLWTNANLGEAVPDVMTPCTWSLVHRYIREAMALVDLGEYSLIGNVGGRFYLNLSLMASLTRALGMSREKFGDLIEMVFGRLPDHLEVPLMPFSRWSLIKTILSTRLNVRRQTREDKPQFEGFIAAAPERCEALHARIQATSRPEALIPLWQNEIEPFVIKSCHMLRVGADPLRTLRQLRHELRERVGQDDMNALTSNANSSANPLASLGPLLGLLQLSRGEIDRATFARRYGHRGAHEFEFSHPRPAEDPDWIDKQLAAMRDAPVDAQTLLARQQAAHDAAWERFRQRHPRKAASVRRRIDAMTAAVRAREMARSELIRGFWVMRAFILRAGALTGQGDAIFFLTFNEILALLGGDDAALARIPARRETHARYSALPPYPAMIRGRFDPFQWAADPRRRSDFFDAQGGATRTSDAITGFAGATGVVEGQARVLGAAEEGDQLQPGEILVTVTTNIGWTPLFPRAAAIVTDVGAPLSHAAIVARELGIPAVVGCGNATMRLRTGDRIRVNGGQGTVEVLQSAEAEVSGNSRVAQEG